MSMSMREKIARMLLMHDMPHVDSWELVGPQHQADYLHRADVVFLALMEPTEGMKEAGDIEGWDGCVTVGLSTEVFLAMIQAAKEGK